MAWFTRAFRIFQSFMNIGFESYFWHENTPILQKMFSVKHLLKALKAHMSKTLSTSPNVRVKIYSLWFLKIHKFMFFGTLWRVKVSSITFCRLMVLARANLRAILENNRVNQNYFFKDSVNQYQIFARYREIQNTHISFAILKMLIFKNFGW